MNIVPEENKTELREGIAWKAPEFEYYFKGASWYWLVILLSILIIGFSILRRNFLFAIFIGIAAIIVIYWGRQKPREINFQITPKGVYIDDRFYPFEELSGFAVHENEIIFGRKKRLSVYLKIFAYGKDLERAKNFLSKFLPTFEYEESLSDHIAKILRF